MLFYCFLITTASSSCLLWRTFEIPYSPIHFKTHRKLNRITFFFPYYFCFHVLSMEMSLLYSFVSLVVWSLTLASHQTDMFVQRGWGVSAEKKREVLSVDFSSFTIKIIFCFIVWTFCLHACIYTGCVPGAQGSQKRVLDALEAELRAVVSDPVGSGNQTWPSSRTAGALNSPLSQLFFIQAAREGTLVVAWMEGWALKSKWVKEPVLKTGWEYIPSSQSTISLQHVISSFLPAAAAVWNLR